MGYLDRLETLAKTDVARLRVAEQSYGGSWKRRGGAGAYFMLARKFDRIENQVRKHDYDVFRAVELDQRPEGIIDDIRDLRRYLLLVEAELEDRGVLGGIPVEVDLTEPEVL